MGRVCSLGFAVGFAILLVAARPAAGEAGPAPVQLSVLDPLQLVEAERGVSGLRLGLLRCANRDVSGFDLCFAATRTRGSLRGLQLSIANEVDGDLTGLQIGFAANYADGNLRGVQLAGVISSAGEGEGVQVASVVAKAKRLRGFQLALITRAEELRGLQLGFLNFNSKGFLPVFPLFNFGW